MPRNHDRQGCAKTFELRRIRLNVAFRYVAQWSRSALTEP
jgi:hypothetical protein